MKHLHVFGSRCYILNDRVQKKKLDARGVKGRFMGYSHNSKAFKVLNNTTGIIVQLFNVKFEDCLEIGTSVADFVEPVS